MGEKIQEYKLYHLAPLTSWKIGGLAERFCAPHTLSALQSYLKQLPPHTPITWLGLGSNVLIRDGGITGAVIGMRHIQGISQVAPDTVRVQAGVSCAKFARFCTRLGFLQAAFFAGIPGTIGGALAMNAGAFGGQTWEWVSKVGVLDHQGVYNERAPQAYQIGYRSVVGKAFDQTKEVFVEADFCFPELAKETVLLDIPACLRLRSQSQPIGTWNCGSVYRNPPGEFAAKLIEACQLKGTRIGDAIVSPKHANFIINCGKASSHDVEALMALIEKRVFETAGITLQKEVKILGQQNEAPL